ncbi:hypothetical protein DFJ74DRAFT_763880 [Hyaloraphidium curvatum]|nr:hypothetical protein DFJ74DRAFT_763880 [Hyaloraphidium curvatum]
MRRRQEDAGDGDEFDAPDDAPPPPPPPPAPAPAAPPPAAQPTSYVIPGMNDGPAPPAPQAAPQTTAVAVAAAASPSPSAAPAAGPNLPLIIGLSVGLGVVFIILPICILLILVVRHRMRRAERRRKKTLSREMRKQQEELLANREMEEAEEWEKAQFGGGRKSTSGDYLGEGGPWMVPVLSVQHASGELSGESDGRRSPARPPPKSKAGRPPKAKAGAGAGEGPVPSEDSDPQDTELQNMLTDLSQTNADRKATREKSPVKGSSRAGQSPYENPEARRSSSGRVGQLRSAFE